jgi:hypothetical protein
MDKYSKEFLNKTIQVWQPFSSAPLSLNDAREITENMTALFSFLLAENKNINKKRKEKVPKGKYKRLECHKDILKKNLKHKKLTLREAEKSMFRYNFRKSLRERINNIKKY